ncbi:MAG: DNRLRE domain-containing protein, partial [Acidobacteriia bacterium]|nr:DNRLRE domain-containing protein [Terriglobia bacterium]
MISRPDEVLDASPAKRWTRTLAAIGVFSLALALAAGPAVATTVTFRQGENGYAGAHDTYIQQNPSSAGNNNGALLALNWDGDDPNGTGYDVYTLIRFDDIFGAGAGQIPVGAQITSATLTYLVSNTGGSGDMREVLVAWQDSATYNSFCGGGCAQGNQYGSTVGSASASALAQQSADVTASVQRWSSGTSNYGWFIMNSAADGVDITSSDGATVSDRPILTVRYNEGPPTSHLVREPYLQLGTPTSMTIVWRTDTSTDSRVQYGTTFGTYDHTATSSAVGTDHYVTITGVSPLTKYYYTVGSTTTQQGGGTAEHYFVTSPPVGTSPNGGFTFWIFGDSGICSDIQNQVRDSMLTYTGSDRPELFLHTGDVAQVAGADDEYTNCVLAYYKDVQIHTPFWPAMGNHDSYSSACQDTPCAGACCTGPYFSTWVLPTNAEAGGVASGTEAYYSWDYGNAHFIVLNGTNVSTSSTGAMANWLRTDLAATSQQWVIAYWHQPPYTKGTHDSDTESEPIAMRTNIVPILESYGVDLVLNGHSHGYERSYLIDGAYSTPTPSYSTLLANGNIVDSGSGKTGAEYHKSPGKNPHEGTVYTVVATGGQGPGGAHNHPVMYYSESANGSALVDVKASELDLTFLRSDGTVRDTFTILKGDLPPKVQSASPAKGSVIGSLSSIDVTFNMDVTGVDAGDLTVNGSPATTITPVSTSIYVFGGFAAPASGTVLVTLAAGGIASASSPSNTYGGESWTYTLDTTPPTVKTAVPAAGATIGALPSVTVTFSKPVINVAAGNLVVNGSPAAALSGIAGTDGPYTFSGFTKPDNGLVTVALAAGSIQDNDGRSFGGTSWTYKLTRRLIINEFLSSNNTATTDEYGEFDDYLEIYNPTDAAVDMSGMFLTDNLDSPAQYRIPAGVTVPAHGYIVFWCDSTPSQGARHTNFNIARAGEQLGLFDTEVNGIAAIDTLTFTTQTTDLASGRFPDGQDGFVTMPPTPGAANTINCTGDAECGPLADACNVGRCVSNKCVAVAANEGGACDDGIACVGPDTCAAGICNGGGDQCPSGQTCNRGTGLCETTQLAALPITVGATWRYVKGSSEPTPSDLTAWTRLGYDDASWLQGPGGFGYGVDCTAQRGTTLSDMASSYSSLFMRKAFRVDNPSRVTSLTLTVDYDDAFVAYLNGTEVARNNVVGSPPAYNQLATADHECSACDGTTCNAATTIDLTAYKSLLVAGTNVLAIQAHNLTLASSDFTIVPALASAEVSGCLYDSDCNDNNTCTDDHCDSDSGACSHTNDNANTCSDGVACTTDSCSSGTCVSTDSCLFGQTCNHTTGNCESAPATITFQQDVSGYTGTQDTYLYQSGPDTNEGAALTWRWDTDDPGSSGLWEYGLIRFDGIFGNGAGQIPAGSTINSATLSLYVENGSVAPVGTINEVLAEWSEATTTWNNFGGEAGVQADEYGTLVGNAPIATGSVAIDVTASLRTWVASPAANLGWIFRPNNTDGMAVTSSEGATTANRPKLTVQFVPPGTSCTGDPDCDDGLFCNGQERCVSLFCQAGTAVDCSDGVACTTDSCNEAANACDHLANNAACDDGDVCTDDTCSPALGCQHGSNTAACNDGNACTTTDTCSGGTCVGSGSLTCNDGIACTTDTCVSPSGCQYVDTCTGGRVCNHTSGVCETPSVEPLPIESGDTWKYFKGLSEPTPTDLTAWTRIGFDDSAWLQGPTGIGYDYYVETGGTNGNGDYGPYIRAELGDMRSCTPTNPPLCNSPGYLSVYMRKAFAVANPAAVASLSFRMYADDGYVAYLNGTEVARIRMTGTPPLYNAVATGGPSVAPPVEQTLDLTSFKGLLATGTNVLAVQGHNAALDSRDLLMIPQLSSTQIQGCTSDAECNDGNPCTDDVCNLGTGVCSNTPDNTNICSDGIACTSDVCLGGVCTSSDTCPTGQTCNHTSGVCDLAPVTATFQQGDANGYSGTVDTYTYAANPTTSYATDVLLTTDFTPPTTDERQILIRFDGIFGSGANQIPPGSTIRSATLTVNVSNAFGTNDYVRFNRMKATWNATETWNSFGASPWNSTAGVQADDVEAVADADVTVNNIPTGLQSIAVTPSLQAWSASPASNFGWVLRSGYADSLAFDSSDVTTIANRPKLSVTYTAPSGPQARMACALESGTAAPGTTVSLTAFLENLGFLGGIRGYQTQLQIIRTSGSGTVGVPCPSGVSVDDGRSDYLFYGLSNDYPVTNCALMRAASALQQGSVTVGTTTPAYLSSYTLGVGSDVALGSTFEFTFAPYPDSALADANADPVSFETGPACVLTVGGCGSNTQCDDDNPCTDDVCNGGVCQNTPNSANACDDGNACTTGDHCDASGACIGGPLLTCDDGNVCTDDSCNQTTGCVHANNTLPCDDGTVCNGHEVCGGGTCNAGTPLNCNDGNVCTTDSCDSVGGCQHANNTLPCDDGTVCNG